MPDNWIYVQEHDVKVGRLQIFNNWSPYLVADPDTVWIGMEYFAAEGDALWRQSDEEMSAFAVAELAALGLIAPDDVLDTRVLHVPKAYPAYFGSYDRFEVLRTHLDRYANLYLIGRNGMHRYNNQDHSMLTAMVAVENIAAGIDAKDNIWSVNVDQEYHETKSVEASAVEELPAISA
jgi:protoporphyrinogen oxidase